MEAAPAAPFGVEYNIVATFAVAEGGGGLELLGNVSCGGSMPCKYTRNLRLLVFICHPWRPR